MKFKVILTEDREDGGYNVNCPSLPGCYSQGDTVNEALKNITEAIEAYLESLEKAKEPLPTRAKILTVEVKT